MWTLSTSETMHHGFMLAVIYFPVMVLAASRGKLHRPLNNTVPAIFVFGDSTVDSGNNNHIMTLMKSNFRPYGINFANHVPTGRFSDGRLVTDFIAAYIGIKETVPAYFTRDLEWKELMTGVSFASAGSGYENLTANMFGVITMKKQVEYFKEYTFKLAGKVGKEKTQSLISKSAFVLSAGSNDIFLSCYSLPLENEILVNIYLDHLMQNAKEILQDLRKEGAKNIVVVGISKIGCVPAVLTINPGDGGIFARNCNETVSSLAMKFNEKLQKTVNEMNTTDFRTFFVDTYKPMEEMIQDATKFGFENVNRGCCGTGLVELTFLCNPVSIICPNPSKFAFFDSVHPSEAAYKNIFKSLRPTIDNVITAFSN